jgi:hypothetical protein
MKTYLFLHVLLFACFAETSFAQLQITKPPAKKEPLLKIPMVHITPVESLFVPVHIDTIKPFSVSLRPIVFGKHENAACEHFKNLKATLVLNAERTNNVMANLQWQTKYAFYATGFTIESSLGDSLHFVPVNSAPVSNTTSFKVNYHLPDHNDYSGLSYYRIKQHNGDSGFAYSNIVAVKGYDVIPFKIYPIPASDKVWVDILPRQSGNLTIIIYDPAGKIAQRQPVSCTANMHITPGINISKLAAGVYQLKIFMPDKTFLSGKFIKE